MTGPDRIMADKQDMHMRLVRQRVENARNEAERFLNKANDFLNHRDNSGSWIYRNGKSFAAAKRASMDLSNALVDVRRSPYERRS